MKEIRLYQIHKDLVALANSIYLTETPEAKLTAIENFLVSLQSQNSAQDSPEEENAQEVETPVIPGLEDVE